MCMASPLPPSSLELSRKKLVDISGNPARDSGVAPAANVSGHGQREHR